MAAEKDQAIVLRRLDYSESSQVLLFFTRLHGPQRLIAKGIKRSTKKKFAVAIDLLEEGEVLYLRRAGSDAQLGTLTEWRQTDLHLALRENLKCLYAAQYAAEITAAMTQEADPHPELYDALSVLLRNLNNGTSVISAMVGYQAQLLQVTGFWPDFGRCVMCDRPAPPGRAGYFAPHQGGLVCRTCQVRAGRTQLVPAAQLETIRQYTLEALTHGQRPSHASPSASQAPLDDETLTGVFLLLNEAITQVMNRPSSLAKFIATPHHDPSGH